MFAVIGAVAITLLMGYIAFVLFALAAMCLLGFDEVNIPMGLVFAALLVADVIGWYFIVGTHIEIGFTDV